MLHAVEPGLPWGGDVQRKTQPCTYQNCLPCVLTRCAPCSACARLLIPPPFFGVVVLAADVDAVHLDGAHGVSVSDDGQYVYVTAGRANSVLTFNRDADTGVLSNMRLYTDNTWLDGAQSIVVAATSVHVAAFNADAVITIARDPDTGMLGRMTRSESHDHLDAVHNLVLSHDHSSLYAAGFNSASVVHWQRSHSGRLWGRTVVQQPVTLNYVRDVR